MAVSYFGATNYLTSRGQHSRHRAQKTNRPGRRLHFSTSCREYISANLAAADLRSARIQLVIAPITALAALLVAALLSVFKPRGMTPYGVRRQ
jgi:hypothetical protein